MYQAGAERGTGSPCAGWCSARATDAQLLRFHDYALPIFCTIQSGELTLHEHAEIAWVKPQLLSKLDWADADRPVVEAFLQVIVEDRE